MNINLDSLINIHLCIAALSVTAHLCSTSAVSPSARTRTGLQKTENEWSALYEILSSERQRVVGLCACVCAPT